MTETGNLFAYLSSDGTVECPFTDLTSGAGKAGAVSPHNGVVGPQSVEGRDAPDSLFFSSTGDYYIHFELMTVIVYSKELV